MTYVLNTRGKYFFVATSGALAAWDVEEHQQYELAPEYVRALVDPAFREKNPTLCEELVAYQLLARGDAATDDGWGWDVLSKLFHVGTMLEMPCGDAPEGAASAEAYVAYCESIVDQMPEDSFEVMRGEDAIALPRPGVAPVESDLFELLARRTSSRNFSDQPVELAALTRILDETFAYRTHDQDSYRSRGIETPTYRRSSPSGGSMQSCEGYVVARRVQGLEPGVYHYRSHSRELGAVGGLPADFSFGSLTGGQMFADDLSAAIVITCRFDKLWWKYPHSRCYRVALMDAGHLSQTAQLVATATGLTTWPTGLFADLALSRLLRIREHSHEYPLLVVGLGTGPADPLNRDLRQPSPSRTHHVA